MFLTSIADQTFVTPSWNVLSQHYGILFQVESYFVVSEYKSVSLPLAIADYQLAEEIMFNDHNKDGLNYGIPGSPLLPRSMAEEAIISGLQPEIIAFTRAVVQNFK